jgi:adenine-specific DNA methylase
MMQTQLIAALFGGTGVAIGQFVAGAFSLIKGRQETKNKLLDHTYVTRKNNYSQFYGLALKAVESAHPCHINPTR